MTNEYDLGLTAILEAIDADEEGRIDADWDQSDIDLDAIIELGYDPDEMDLDTIFEALS